MTKQSAFRPVSSRGSRNWLRLTLSALPLCVVTCDAGQLEPDANAVAVTVLGLTADATKLVVTTTLDGKPSTNQTPYEITSKLTRFGIRLAKELSGTLALNIDSYDVDLCKVGSGTVTTQIGSPYRFEVTASMKTVAPRQCPPPPPPKTCAPNLFCWSNPLPQGNTFQGLWSLSASDVWAVGDAGTIHHYDGTNWTASTSGTTESLLAVWAASPTEVVAVGTNGKVIRYDGTKWNPETSGTTKRLSAIWGTGTDSWAVGEGGTILRRTAGTWSPQGSGVANNLNGVWGRSASEVYAVGDAGVIRKFDGTSWSMMTSTTAMNLASIWGDATTATAVGANGTILGLAGTTWSAQTSGTTEQLSGVFSPTAGQYIAVGTSGTILRGTAGAWSTQPAGTNVALSVARGTSTSDVWVGGASGQLLRYDGNKWNSSRQGFEPVIRAIAALKANDIWAVGDGGLLAHYDGTKWTTANSGTTANLNTIWAVSPTEVYAGGDNRTLLRFLGTTWATYPVALPSNLIQDVRGLWASGSANIWGVGNAAIGASAPLNFWMYDGFGWKVFDIKDPVMGMTRATTVNSIWGTTQGATTIVYFVGKGYAAFVNLTAGMIQYNFPLAGTELRAVYGTSSTDVWAVGDSGLVLHYDGAAWGGVATGLGTAQLLGAWRQDLTSPLWVVGDQGTLWQYDGTNWAAKETATRNRLTSVRGLSQMDVWVGGAGGTMLHTLPQ
jgi:hypothetical protein